MKGHNNFSLYRRILMLCKEKKQDRYFIKYLMSALRQYPVLLHFKEKLWVIAAAKGQSSYLSGMRTLNVCEGGPQKVCFCEIDEELLKISAQFVFVTQDRTRSAVRLMGSNPIGAKL